MQNTNHTAFNYWKLTLVLFMALTFAVCQKVFGQTNGNPKASQDSTVIIQNFIDSVTQHTSIRALQSWLYENVSGKTYSEGKFNDLYNIYIQTKFNAWIAEEKKKANPK